MSHEISTNTSFQQRVFEKIRDQLGDLMTDAELKKVVDAAIQKAFFEEREVRTGYYSSDVKKIHSLFVELMEKEMKVRVSAAVDKWITEHPDDFTKAIDAALAKGFFNLVRQHFEEKFSQPVYELGMALKAKGVLS